MTYGGEMDYKTYLDFVLALENRKEPQVKIKVIGRKKYFKLFNLHYIVMIYGQSSVKTPS